MDIWNASLFLKKSTFFENMAELLQIPFVGEKI